MARGNSPQTQVFYKGSSGDQFCIFVDSVEQLQKWKADSTIPMVDVVAGWKVLVPEHGKQGVLNTASKQQLENEFGKDAKEDDIFKKILQEGSVQSSEVCCVLFLSQIFYLANVMKSAIANTCVKQNSERIGVTNESQGGRQAH
ncbi:ribosome maturation protein [Alternaria rosae]|uniref:ribosome maturation protein n=1 Tax=Alternaria rosae TaxID=1187941 RepID=UPI001E8D98BB|nr:ribosome maturation protein [Alternaria rosae]KAH6853026.1 ribosome maturation protein [Alternaria rosae]